LLCFVLCCHYFTFCFSFQVSFQQPEERVFLANELFIYFSNVLLLLLLLLICCFIYTGYLQLFEYTWNKPRF
jgi:hypothetical protein